MFVRSVSRQIAPRRAYSTSSQPSFYFRYGTPLVKCTVIATATTLAWQLLWQHLEYQEFRNESEQHIAKLENRIKTLEHQKTSTA
ncbi:hypothetical protein BCR43DRAFT_481760 [Syncephalastrum racemosum]|uniref:Uncharacterized protein n=1 Tax=Syncephalastrum racemosum TaxID=13706 RepID=A0A1X2HSK9_SYNRA|nr:hypothetical protein BCR43DRAFT_481760 [Syncephalastrum racemosum]